MFKSVAKVARSKRGVGITLSIWVLLMVLLSALAPSSRDAISPKDGSGLPESALSEQAKKEMNRYFSNDASTPAILVFTSDKPLTTEELSSIAKASKAIDEAKIKSVKEVLPLYQMPSQVLQAFVSEDGTSISLPVTLLPNLEAKEMSAAIKKIEKETKDNVSNSVQYYMTGPAAIAADATKLFENADVVLILSTVALILVLLVVIYRSPLLAIIPLLACGIVYQVTDKILGLVGKAGVFLDSQTLSIMSILLFAAITDYSLFIFARFREELKAGHTKYQSMQNAMKHVAEPIFFSGATVIVSVLILFFASDAAYRNFAPVFAIAMFIIVIGGLTLVPALFTLFGKIAFWPFIPKPNKVQKEKITVWSKLGTFVTKRPGIIAIVITIIMLAFSANVFNMQFSFNLLKSFPEDLESRQGFEILEEKYSPGSLAPTTVLITSNEKINGEQLAELAAELEKQKGVESISPTPEAIKRDFSSTLSENGKAAKLQLTLKDNPYSQKAMDVVKNLQKNTDQMLKDSDTKETFSLYFSGETALQADIDRANDRDTLLVVSLVTIFITIMLGILTRSIIAPIYMMGTILLSFFSALGIGTFLLDAIFGVDAVSSRIPLYTFVFLVALGVDYNIMLISRIQEEVGHFSMKEAVQRGVTYTGGVISSAGLILAATFAVLTTQPIMELFTFGFIVALGILLDTFIIRSMLVPAIVVLLGNKAFWPFKQKNKKLEDYQA
ncbi:MMPL family transporter [Bacillus massiliigorillae]|uniref:MMPL family transporter n=1 Tax=Bacillus massiliigorillae TaxID=1243664 RepID=UPI0003A5B1E9|nr:MMPL family transporter [Bacillus massiliigorillae]